MRMIRSTSIGLAGAVLAGCVSYGPGRVQVGDPEAAVVASMGTPAGRYPLPAGATRLAYARGPAGKHTYMIDLGADGRVTAVNQVLGEKQFAALPTGITEDDLLLILGPPADRRPLGLRPGTVWSYRYETFECKWFRVTLGPDHRVQDGSYGIDPACEEKPRGP